MHIVLVLLRIATDSGVAPAKEGSPVALKFVHYPAECKDVTSFLVTHKSGGTIESIKFRLHSENCSVTDMI